MMDFLIKNCGNLALLGFFIAFVLVTFSVLRPSKKAELESHAMIPLKGDE